MSTAAIYVRLSQDREGQTSTERQEHEARAFCAARGLEVVEVFADTGRSAFKDVERPAYEEALQGLQEGRYEALVVWKLDRLSRKGMGAVGLVLDRLEGTGRYLLSVVDGVDTRTAQGRLMVAILSEMARAESQNISTRVRSAFDHARRTGRWVYGRPPWGYEVRDGRLAPHPETGPLARAAVEGLLAGASFRQTAMDLNAAGVLTAQGTKWSAGTLGYWATSPLLAGLLPDGRRSRKLWRDPDTGEPVSVGEGIATEAELATIRTMAERRLQDGPFRKTGRNAGKRLLSGLAKCAQCGAAMSARGGSYACGGAAFGRGCPGTTTRFGPVEVFVEETALRRLRALSPEEMEPVALAWRGTVASVEAASADTAQEALREAQERLESLEEDFYVRRAFQGREEVYRRLHARLLAEVERAEAAVGTLPRVDALGALAGLLDPDTATEAWQSATLEDRRAVLGAMLESVLILPARAKGVRFSGPERVAFAWREIPRNLPSRG